MRAMLLILTCFFQSAIWGMDMQVGHVYSYESRTGESDSTFLVLKIDELKGKSVVSVSVRRLKVKSPKSQTGTAETITHLPITLGALNKSSPKDTGVVEQVPWPNEGYDLWMKAVSEGKGGFWDKPLDDTIDALESALNQ